jgi:hypothetical protein
MIDPKSCTRWFELKQHKNVKKGIKVRGRLTDDFMLRCRSRSSRSRPPRRAKVLPLRAHSSRHPARS